MVILGVHQSKKLENLKKNGTIIELHPRKRNNRDEGLSEKYLFLMLFKGLLKVTILLDEAYFCLLKIS